MPPRQRFSASTTEVLCLHRGGVVPPPRRSCASTAEVLCLHNGGLVPPPRSLTATPSLQRCYAAATGCSNAPVPSPRRGLLGPAVLVLQPVHHSPLAARAHAAVTAGVPQSHYQSRDFWSLQPLCCAEVLCLHSRGLVPPQRRSCASTTEVLCLHRGGVVPPPRRSCASTAEVLCLHNGGLEPPPRSLTATPSLQRCYAAATGCSNGPVPGGRGVGGVAPWFPTPLPWGGGPWPPAQSPFFSGAPPRGLHVQPGLPGSPRRRARPGRPSMGQPGRGGGGGLPVRRTPGGSSRGPRGAGGGEVSLPRSVPPPSRGGHQGGSLRLCPALRAAFLGVAVLLRPSPPSSPAHPPGVYMFSRGCRAAPGAGHGLAGRRWASLAGDWVGGCQCAVPQGARPGGPAGQGAGRSLCRGLFHRLLGAGTKAGRFVCAPPSVPHSWVSPFCCGPRGAPERWSRADSRQQAPRK